MYFTGTLSVDPSQVTQILKVKPARAFKKMLYLMTAGAISDKEEHETFCALVVLQQLNACFRRLGVNNIVRLAKDGTDFYLDEAGKEDDLKDALEHFQLEVDQVEASVFQTLQMVLEHEDEHFKYLIQAKVNRTHEVGAYPIEIEVNGLLSEFKASSKSGNEVRKKMEGVFSSQDKYDAFKNTAQSQFNQFVGQMELELKKFVDSDNIKNDTKMKMIRPKKKVDQMSAIPTSRENDRTVFYGYYGTSDYLFYAWLWAASCHDHSIYINDVTILDEAGSDLIDVGETGFDAGEADTLNPDVEFDAPADADVTVPEGSDFTPADDGSSSSWFDFGGGDSGGDSGGGDSSCSSCGSSCSSCGGCS